MPDGVGHQLGGEQLGGVDEADQPVEGEDQPEGAAGDGDGTGVVGDVEGVLPGLMRPGTVETVGTAAGSRLRACVSSGSVVGLRRAAEISRAVALPRPSWQDGAVRFRGPGDSAACASRHLR